MTPTLYERALQVALNAHAGQTDKGGTPYILHPIAVAAKFEDAELQAIALLHDVVEDTHVLLFDLDAWGFPATVVDAVDALTRRANESYKGYLRRLKPNWAARQVKIADINDNLRRERVQDPKVRATLENNRPMYFQALAFLDHFPSA